MIDVSCQRDRNLINENSGKGKWHTLFRVIGMDRDQFPLHKHNGII